MKQKKRITKQVTGLKVKGNSEVTVGVRMRQELRDELEKLAAQDGRKLSNLIRVILEKFVRQSKQKQIA